MTETSANKSRLLHVEPSKAVKTCSSMASAAYSIVTWETGAWELLAASSIIHTQKLSNTILGSLSH